MRILPSVGLGVVALLLVLQTASLADTFTVTSAADSGGGSLREAIGLANASPAPRAINFGIGGGGLQTITLQSALPEITKSTTLDATTQPGYAGTPLIVIDGNRGDWDGLVVNAFFTGNAANTSTVRGLCIINCGTNGGTARNGLVLRDGDSVTVTGCFLGIDAAGTAAAPNTGAGVRVELAVATIGGASPAMRNVISGNVGAGVDANTDGTNQASAVTIVGNFIGVAADGTTALGNGGDGVFGKAKTTSGAFKVGGAAAGEGNVISGNGGNGLRTARGTTITGNFIGVAADGTTALGNTSHGVLIEGSTSTFASNVISGNGGAGIRVNSTSGGRSTIGSAAAPNFIGTDKTGMLPCGNGSHGVEIVLGSASGSGNVIGSNNGAGMRIAAGDGSIFTSKIGINAAGTAALPNTGDGILIDNVPNIQLDFNTIGGNTGSAIHITGPGATGTKVVGNNLGIGTSGAALGNGGNGITIDGGAQDAIIGSKANADSDTNFIANNGGGGVFFPTRTQLLSNQIYNNTGLPLDRGGDGVDPPNTAGTINFAQITSATRDVRFPDRIKITVTYHQPSLAGQTVRVYFHGSPMPNRDQQIFIGYDDLQLDANGNGTKSFDFIAATQAKYVTNHVVTDLNQAPVSSSEGSLGVDSGGGGGIPTLTTDSVANNASATTVADPVSTFSGELFDLEAVDLDLGGPFPLFFARYYGSRIKSDGNLSSALGRNRLHNFDAKLTVSGTNATVVLSDGRVAQFTKAGTKWTLVKRNDIAFQLAPRGTAFAFADPRSQIVWTFDGTSGALLKIEDGRGNTHTLTYTGGQLASVSDGLGRTLALTYDMNGKLAKVRDPVADGANPAVREVNFLYDGENLASASDALSHTTLYNHDASGLLSTQRPLGNVPRTQAYDGSARVVSQVEQPAAGVTQTTALAYDGATKTTTITDPASKTRIHTYTATGELKSLTDEAGQTVNFSSDATGRRAAVKDQFGRTTIIAYHAPSGKPARVTAEDGTATSFSYKARVVSGLTFYDLVKVTYPDRTSRSFTYDAKGNLVTEADQLGKKSTYTYNARGQLLTATNPAGGISTFTYDAAGNLATSKDSDTGMTLYTYDGFSRLTRLTHPDMRHLDFAYDDADNIVSITDERGKAFTFEYDANDKVTKVTDPANGMTQFTYDALDRLVQVADRLGKVSMFGFDARDLLATEKDELNQISTTAYDTRQRVTSVQEPGGAMSTFGYDDLGQLTSLADPLGNTSTLVRNKVGSIISVSDPLRNTELFQRDALQRVTRIVEADGRQTVYTYDKRGALIGAARDGIGACTYLRDPAGRIIKITDPNLHAWSYAYTPAGRLKSVTDPLGRKTAFSYDSQTGVLASFTGADNKTCTVTRDESQRATQIAFTGGPTQQFSYDALGRLLTANDAVGAAVTYDAEGRVATASDGTHGFAATRDDGGRIISIAYDGMLAVDYTYDTQNRLTKVTDSVGMGTQITFLYDLAGRLTSITRSNGTTTTYGYDDADRRVRVRHAKSGVDFIDLQTTLNAAGDVTQTDETAALLPAVAPATTIYTYDAASQISSAEFLYDLRGRLTTSPGHTFAWDAASRLKALDGVTFTYNGLNHLATRTEGGVTTSFTDISMLPGAPTGIIANAAQSSGAYYVWTPEGRLLYAIPFDSMGYKPPRFYHFDRAGSTMAITDENGAVAATYAYTPYGQRVAGSSAADPFTFVGEHGVRTEGAFYQMRARYYDPQTARFLSPDPGAPSLTDPRTLDPYQYALGNPLRYIDPDGAKSFGMDDESAIGTLESFFGRFLIGPIINSRPDPREAFEEVFESTDDYGNVTEVIFAKTKVEMPMLRRETIFTASPAMQTALQGGGMSLTNANTPDTRSRQYGMDALKATGGAPFVQVGLGGGVTGSKAPSFDTDTAIGYYASFLFEESADAAKRPRRSPMPVSLPSPQPVGGLSSPQAIPVTRGDNKKAGKKNGDKAPIDAYGLIINQLFGKKLKPKQFKKALEEAIRHQQQAEELKKLGVTPKK